MTLDEIQRAIGKLSPDERAELRVWLAQFDAARSEQDSASESTAEKLGRMAGRTFADFRKRVRDP